MCVLLYVCVLLYICASMYVYVCASMYVCASVYVCFSICICVLPCVCVSIVYVRFYVCDVTTDAHIKCPHRFCLETIALCKIHWSQKNTNLLICKLLW